MYQSFIAELLQFVQTIDILENEIYNKLVKTIFRYVKKEWKIQNIRVMRLFFIKNEKILQKVPLEHPDFSNPYITTYKLEEGSGQMGFAIKNKKSLWITAKNKGYLEDTDEYIDQWNDLKNIPKYIPPIGSGYKKAKTSIIIYFVEDNTEWVINYESPKYLIIDKKSKEYLQQLSLIIHKIIKLKSNRDAQKKDSERSIDSLNEILSAEKHFHEKDKIFFAYPQNSDQNVIELIKETVKETIEELKKEDKEKYQNIYLFDWRKLYKTGHISDQMFKKILDYKYGICYLSEITENDNGIFYKDNPNVIFEAGLMHSKFYIFNDKYPKWLLIREQNSHKLDFNLKDLNRIEIIRDNENRLKIKEFKEQIRNLLTNMLK